MRFSAIQFNRPNSSLGSFINSPAGSLSETHPESVRLGSTSLATPAPILSGGPADCLGRGLRNHSTCMLPATSVLQDTLEKSRFHDQTPVKCLGNAPTSWPVENLVSLHFCWLIWSLQYSY